MNTIPATSEASPLPHGGPQTGTVPAPPRRRKPRNPEALAPLEPMPPPAEVKAEVPFPSGGALPQRPVAPPRTRRRILSAILFMVLPVALAVAYFGFLASDQFYATADYAIRFSQSAPAAASSGGGGGGGLGAALGGGAAAAAFADMFIVRDYILSHQILADLEPVIDIRAIYSHPQADRLVRLGPGVSKEDLLDYWRGMISVRCDMSTGITHLGVRAFTAEDSRRVADSILRLSEALVNRLSDRAQTDRVGLAESDVQEAYARVAQAFDALRVYQESARQVSPELFVQARSEIEARIGQEITQYETQIERLSRELPDDAPGIRQLRKRLDIARAQLEAERQRSTASTGETKSSASEVFTEFSKLKLESEFAAKAYDSALSSLEQARMEAAKQDRYLEAFVRPQLPETAEYPHRPFNIALVAVGAFLLWSIGGLIIAAIREHL